jgi:hypothetical protein
MIFLDAPSPTNIPGWWMSRSSLLNDRFHSLGCDHRVGNRKCRGAAARFYQADAGGHPIHDARALCLVHFRIEVGEPSSTR